MPPERPYEHWMELVRTFRTYYDHFRIAFPDLTSIPKHYDKNWGKEFRVQAREFVRDEDMHAVKLIFDCAGYGTERWDKLVSLSPEDLTGHFDRIIALNGFVKDEASDRIEDETPSADERVSLAEKVLGQDLWKLLLDSPESIVEMLDEASSANRPPSETESPVAPTAPIDIRSPEQPQEETPEVVDTAIARLIDAVGADFWERILNDPDILVQALQTQEPGSEDRVSEAPDDLVEEPPKAEVDAEEDTLAALEAIREEKREVEARLEKVQDELSTAGKAADKLDQQLADQAREHGATEKKLVSLEEKLKEAEAKAEKLRIPEKSETLAPTKAAQQLVAFQVSLEKAEERLGELETKSETDDLRIKELMADVKREAFLRQKFEDDLDETRNALKEQIHRLHAVLNNAEEIPSIDEFEQMTGDELMEYIGDVEKDKKRVMAGLDALDAQEESYQKQIEVQSEELGAIQADIGKLKESSLAMEVEEMRETMEKQRSQLQMLMGYSKNLKSRNEQLAERQEPLRSLVQKMNLQEKALVRFIRMNFDSKFMPENAFM